MFAVHVTPVEFGKRRGAKTSRPKYELGFKPVLREGSHSDVSLTPYYGAPIGNPARELLAIHREIAERRARGATRADAEDLFKKRNDLVADHDVHFSPRITEAVAAGIFSPQAKDRPGHARFSFGPLSGQLGLRGVQKVLYNLIDTMSARVAGDKKAPTDMSDPRYPSQAYFPLKRDQPLHKHGKSPFGESPSGPLGLWYIGRPLLNTVPSAGSDAPLQQLPAILSEAELKKLFPKGEYKKYCQLESNGLDVMITPDIDRDPVMTSRGLTLQKLMTPLCSPERFFGSRPVNQAFLVNNDTTFHGTTPVTVSPDVLQRNPRRHRQNGPTLLELGTPSETSTLGENDYHRLLVFGDGREKAS